MTTKWKDVREGCSQGLSLSLSPVDGIYKNLPEDHFRHFSSTVYQSIDGSVWDLIWDDMYDYCEE